MNSPFLTVSLLALSIIEALPSDGIQSKTTHAKAYGATKGVVNVDPSKDLPRYPAVEPRDAIATWQVKKGFKLELAAHEPQVRDPIAISFDENGRMFVCEMIDYSEMRDVTPHLGRVSVLEDKDGDGYFETSRVFADDLPWPTGVFWANGGIFVAATPDIWFFQDKDGDGKAEVRERVFTGFGTGLKILNVQGLLNSFQWGLDGRIHLLAGGGNRGRIKCLKRPELPEVELGGQDFWFDPQTYEFGLEGGGAQYGMSFDNYGRKFACSNSDHLQYWVHDDKYARRNPHALLPPARQSIAADGGAAEVFRMSPDEPWRIIRTRWRISGVVKGAVEGGGRVSGYFTGATGTTIYRGDAYGSDFVGNSFTGDAGGQLVHRKLIRTADDGVSLVGERPSDEKGFEFAASNDTWVRVVNFANAPDGCLHFCDMYREVIEHPWSIPDEIKKHIDLNSGNDRGRIYRLVKEGSSNRRSTQVNLGKASTEELVRTLEHTNGWHRDTAARLLTERRDEVAIALLDRAAKEGSALGKIHALSLLAATDSLNEEVVLGALSDQDAHVRELAVSLSERFGRSEMGPSKALSASLSNLAKDPVMRVRYQLLLSIGEFGQTGSPTQKAWIGQVVSEILNSPGASDALKSAVASLPPSVSSDVLKSFLTSGSSDWAAVAPVARTLCAKGNRNEIAHILKVSSQAMKNPTYLRAILEGLKSARVPLADVDSDSLLQSVFADAKKLAPDPSAKTSDRVEAIMLLGIGDAAEALEPLTLCLEIGQSEEVQLAAVRSMGKSVEDVATDTLLFHLDRLLPRAKDAAVEILLTTEKRTLALLKSIENGQSLPPSEFPAAQIQSLIRNPSKKVTESARRVLASVIPPSREEVNARFKPAINTQGDAKRGQIHFAGRCIACHVANGQGIEVGPNLVTVKTKGREALLTAILEPHKEVAPQFIGFTVTAKDGRTFHGIVTQDDATNVALKMMGGSTQVLPRAEVKGSQSSGQSLMPEGLEAGLDVQGMADLLTFIETVK